MDLVPTTTPWLDFGGHVSIKYKILRTFATNFFRKALGLQPQRRVLKGFCVSRGQLVNVMIAIDSFLKCYKLAAIVVKRRAKQILRVYNFVPMLACTTSNYRCDCVFGVSA